MLRSSLALGALLAFGALTGCAQTAGPAPAQQPGAGLYDDVKHYESFGIHRFGSPGLDAALDWMAARLKAAGLAVEAQDFMIGRQYVLEAASLTVGGEALAVVPQWWMPDEAANFSLSAPIAREGQAEGRFVRLKIPYDQGAYLGKAQRAAVAEALRRRPAAVLLTIDHPSGEIFTYNVSQEDAPWPVPVILVAPRDEAKLAAAEASGERVTFSVRGRHERQVRGRNLIGRLDRGKARTLVVSTPVSSWFASTCERGPGIAAFLATAAVARASFPEVNLVFVATSGHEIGHGGMTHFIQGKAPPPERVAAWLHYGASLACHAEAVPEGASAQQAASVNSATRYLAASPQALPFVEPAFRDVAAHRLVGERARVGELRDILEAGYPRAFGMAGLHPLFHTPRDHAGMTSPALLDPVVRASIEALRAAAQE